MWDLLEIFKSRFIKHKHNLNSDKGNQTTLSKFYKANKNNISQIKWSIIRKIIEYIPEKIDNCSICNLEKMAEMDRENSLSIRNELATVYPHFKSIYF